MPTDEQLNARTEMAMRRRQKKVPARPPIEDVYNEENRQYGLGGDSPAGANSRVIFTRTPPPKLPPPPDAIPPGVGVPPRSFVAARGVPAAPAYDQPQTGPAGPPEGVDPGELEVYHRELVSKIKSLKAQRVAVGQAGDRATATALGIRERELLPQLYEANRLRASMRAPRTPEQERVASESLQRSYTMAKQAMGEQAKQSYIDAQKQKAEAFFLLPSNRPENAARVTRVGGYTPSQGRPTEYNEFGQSPDIERQILDRPRYQGEDRVRERLAGHAETRLQQALAEQQRVAALPETFTPEPRSPRPVVSDFERREVMRRIGLANDERAFEASQMAAENRLRGATTEADIATQITRRQVAERIGTGQDVGSQVERGNRATAVAGAAKAITRTSPESIVATAESRYPDLEGLDFTNVSELEHRVQGFRDTVLGPLSSYAAEDPVGARRAAEEIKARLRAIAADRAPGVGSLALAVGMNNPQVGRSYEQIAATIASLITEIDRIVGG